MSDNKILTIYKDEYGYPTASTHLTENSETRRCEIKIKDRVIPILFVPGSMGSNLKYRDIWSGEETAISLTDEDELAKMQVDDAWQPPSSISEKIGALISGIFRGKEERRREMNPDVAFVDWESNKIRPLPRQMFCTEREVAMANPDNDHETDGIESSEAGESKQAREPFNNQKVMTDKQKIAQEARLRGWGTIYQESYVPFLVFLEETLNSIPSCSSIEEYEQVAESGVWRQLLPLFTNSQQVSEQEPASETERQNVKQLAQWLQQAADCEFRIYACGYNWLRDNFESGSGYKKASVEHFESKRGSNKRYGASDLKSRIVKILQECQKTDSRCDEVIVLTHSMGGLVGRAYAKSQNGRHIAGIYHNVMPATGAPAFYKRLKAGFGGEGLMSNISSPIFGYSAKRVTPVLLNSAGALELMPWFNYKVLTDGSTNWLRIAEANSPEQIRFSLNTSDLISHAQAWYSLMPALCPTEADGEHCTKSTLSEKENRWKNADPRINPGGLVSPLEQFKNVTDSERFNWIVDEVKTFQISHAGFYQKGKTHIAYGQDENYKSWGSITWLCSESLSGINESALKSAKLLNRRGIYTGNITLVLADGKQLTFKLSKAVDSGDGTVPADSGCAPTGKTGGRTFIESGYDHQGSYGKKSMSRTSSLFSILDFTARTK